MSYENSGMKIGVIESFFTILKRAAKTVSGKGLTAFAFLLVCLAAASGYLLGSQVSLSEEQERTFIKSEPPPSSSEYQLKLQSVEEAEEPGIINMKFGEIQPAASLDSENRVIMTKAKEAEKQDSMNEKLESAVEIKAKRVRYSLAGGAYIFHDNLQKDRQFAEMLGLPFQVKEKKKKVEMTRLLVGTFPVEKGRVELKILEAYTRDAFAIRHGMKVSIYAGSFYYPADAHRWKNRFMEQGLNVEEVSVQVEMPLYASYIGDFETVEEAMLAGSRAESAGRRMPIIGIR